jgi:hypothetical protein
VRIPARLLRHSCTFQVRTATKSATSGQVTYAWATAQADVACRLDEGSGREFRAAEGKYVRATHTLFVNQSDVTVTLSEAENRVLVGTATYDILLIADAGGAGAHYEIALERIY